MSVVLQPEVEERLRSREIIWLNSVRPDGRPHSVPVWFLWDNGTVVIFSKPNNQKLVNVSQNQNVVLTVDGTKNGSEVVILEGTAKVVEQGDESAILQAYNEKYRDGLKRIGVPAESFAKLYSQKILVTVTRVVEGR